MALTEFSDHVVRIELPAEPSQLDLSPDGSRLAVGFYSSGSGPGVRVYDTETGAETHAFGHGVFCGRGVAFGSDGDTLHILVEVEAGASELRRVHLVEGTEEKVAEYGIGERSSQLVRNADASLLAVLGNAAEVWDTRRREVVRHITTGRDEVLVGAFHATEPSIFLYAKDPGFITRWSCASHTEEARWPAPSPRGGELAVSPDGRFLYAKGALAAGAFLYETESGKRLKEVLYDGKSPQPSHVFGPDGAMLCHLTGTNARGRRMDTLKRVKGPTDVVPEGIRRSVPIAASSSAPKVALSKNNDVAILTLVEG